MSDNLRSLAARRLRAFPGNIFQYKNYLHSRDLDWENDLGITPDNVKLYLTLHENVLEEYIEEYITPETLEQWLSKKSEASHDASAKHKHTAHENFTGEDIVATQKELLKEIFERSDHASLLYQVASLIATIINADYFHLFLYQSSGNDLCFYVPSSKKYHHDKDKPVLKFYGPVVKGATVAAHVAKTLEPVLVSDVLEDERFPKGIGKDSHMRFSVICTPIVMPSRDPLGVFEFLRASEGNPFGRSEFKEVMAAVAWIGTAIHQCHVNKSLVTQIDLNEFLLEIAKIIFVDPVSVERLVEMIMIYTKTLVNADRCSLFLVDEEKRELYATLFDEGVYKNGRPVFKRRDEIRFSIEAGLAGYVARTGEIVNIRDAYQDKRFNRNIDVQTGYTTKHILCMPIISNGKAIGVVQMINKRDNASGFTNGDEASFKMFAVYCALAIHFSKMMQSHRMLSAKHNSINEQLQSLIPVPDEELKAFLRKPLPDQENLPQGFGTFYFFPEKNVEPQLSQLFVHMVFTMFGQQDFDMRRLGRFVLSVKRNYRGIPYHNWKHGWLVAHSLYAMLLRIKDLNIFSPLRMKALLVAALCHDIDHRGLTNDYLKRFKEPLSVLYDRSFNENHHLEVTKRILTDIGSELFLNISEDDYRQLLSYISHAILSSDLIKFLKERKHLKKLVHSKKFDLQLSSHQDHVISLIMTLCDLSSSCMSWNTQRDLVQNLYEEFFTQGDSERKQGNQPIPMFDRDYSHLIPHNQTEFLKNVVWPSVELFMHVFPNMEDIGEACKENIELWESTSRNETWEPTKSVP